MKKHYLSSEWALLVTAIFLTACDPPVQEHHEPGPDLVSEQFVRANQYSLRRHQDHISAFVEWYNSGRQ